MPGKTREPENFFHHLLMLYFPWRDELADLTGKDQTFASKLCEPEVQSFVEINRAKFESDAEEVEEALEFLRNNNPDNLHSSDSLNDQENAEMHIELEQNFPLDEYFNEQAPEHLGDSVHSREHSNAVIVAHTQPSEILDDELRKSVRSFNSKQRLAYDTVLTWCRTKVINLNSKEVCQIDPLYLFVTGGGGTGKSHLIKAVYHTALKTLRHGSSNPEKATILLMAPTGVAAININGTTMHTALAIPKQSGHNLPAISDQKKTQLRILLTELKVIIIDEISMVSNVMLMNIHNRLKEIFATPNSELFAGISLITVGDLYQLPPIRSQPIFFKLQKCGLQLVSSLAHFQDD